MATVKKPATEKKSSIYDEFEVTSTKTLKKLSASEDEELMHGRSGTRVELQDGMNKVRFYPKRKGEVSFYKMRGSHWFKMADPQGKRGEFINIVVPDARIHAGMEQDISEVYVDFVKQNLDSSDAAESRKIKKVSGTGYNGGLLPNITWVAYATIIGKDGKKGKPGEFEFKKTVRDALVSEMIVEDEDEAIETDPFTHPKDGRYVQITYDPKAKKAADYYKVRVSDNKNPITPEELAEFAKMPRLSDLPIFTYSIEDFEKSLEGLQAYDEENEINLFESDEFQDLVKDYRKQLIKKLKEEGKVGDDSDLPFKEDDDEVEVDEKPVKKGAKKPEEKKAKTKQKSVEEEEEVDDEVEEENDDDNDADEFDAMSRQELKQYKVDNDLDIKIFKSDDDDAIREKIRAVVSQSDPEEETITEEEPEEVEEEKKPAPKKGKLTLDDIKKKLTGKK